MLYHLNFLTDNSLENGTVRSTCERLHVHITRHSLSQPSLHKPSSMTQKSKSHTYAPYRMSLPRSRLMGTAEPQKSSKSYPDQYTSDGHHHHKNDIPEERYPSHGRHRRPSNQESRRVRTSNQWRRDGSRPEPVQTVVIPSCQVYFPPAVVVHPKGQHKQRRSNMAKGKQVRFGTCRYY